MDGGRPAILLTDLYYLDHYGSSAHFPGHAVVLAGYDAEVAYLSDTSFEELQTTRLESLARARHGKHPLFPLEGHMFTMPEGAELGDVREASAEAIARNAKQMLDPPLGEYEGLPALRRFAAEVGDWPQGAEDWQWCARFCYQVIERRGTGGGNFRLMYSRFLDEVGHRRGAAGRRGGRPVDGARRAPARRERGGRAPAGDLVAGRRGGRRGARRGGASVAGARRLVAL